MHAAVALPGAAALDPDFAHVRFVGQDLDRIGARADAIRPRERGAPGEAEVDRRFEIGVGELQEVRPGRLVEESAGHAHDTFRFLAPGPTPATRATFSAKLGSRAGAPARCHKTRSLLRLKRLPPWVG